MDIRKTTILIDQDLVRQAGAVLGTTGLKRTVQRSLEQVVAEAARRRFLDRLGRMEGLDLADPEVMGSRLGPPRVSERMGALSWMVDKSALARMRDPAVGDVLRPLILAGAVARCGVLELEILYSARNWEDLLHTRQELAAALALVPTEQRDFERAADVMALLAKQGQHRSVNLEDLILAAVAERAKLAVLHYDQDYDVIATVTGQSVRWVAPRGSIP